MCLEVHDDFGNLEVGFYLDFGYGVCSHSYDLLHGGI